jgi:beta-lactamase class A
MSPRSAAASAASDRAAPTAAAAAALRTGLEGRLRAAAAHALRGGGEMGVALAFLPTGERVRWNADALFPTASVIKVAIVAELFAQAAEGRVALDTPVRVTDEALVAGSGVLACCRRAWSCRCATWRRWRSPCPTTPPRTSSWRTSADRTR